MLLRESGSGVQLGDELISNITYADDITLISSTATGLIEYASN
jgi:hypothetical protein